MKYSRKSNCTKLMTYEMCINSMVLDVSNDKYFFFVVRRNDDRKL